MLGFKSKYESNFGKAQRSVTEAIEKIEMNIEWMREHFEDVSRLLRQYAEVLMA
jgi:hypothetical protein